MSISCDAALLAAGAAGFDRLSERELLVVQTYLMAYCANQLAGNTLDPQQLITAAAKFQEIEGMTPAVQCYELCQIASAVGA